MFDFWKKETHDLDAMIARLLQEMEEYGPDSEEFPKLMTHLEKLHRMRAETRTSKISPDTMAIIVGNIVGILIIVSYEHTHVMATKALSLLKTK